MAVLNDSTYHRLVVAGNDSGGSGTPVLVDACAQWCGPCKLIEPVLKKCADKWQDQVAFAKFNVDDDDSVANVKLELLLQNVMPRSLPSLILFQNGKAMAQHNGVITEEQLDDFLTQNLLFTATATTAAGSSSTKPTERTAGFVSFAASSNDDDYMLSDL